mmetsp:Transcript_16269/g.43848  ORF Transcript_16269/g.43848 Transcript_16269/m.43848 type:complete len:237 (+) Transcript_16269:82-792(+)
MGLAIALSNNGFRAGRPSSGTSSLNHNPQNGASEGGGCWMTAGRDTAGPHGNAALLHIDRDIWVQDTVLFALSTGVSVAAFGQVTAASLSATAPFARRLELPRARRREEPLVCPGDDKVEAIGGHGPGVGAIPTEDACLLARPVRRLLNALDSRDNGRVLRARGWRNPKGKTQVVWANEYASDALYSHDGVHVVQRGGRLDHGPAAHGLVCRGEVVRREEARPQGPKRPRAAGRVA